MRREFFVCVALIASLQCFATHSGPATAVRAHYRSQWVEVNPNAPVPARTMEWQFERRGNMVGISEATGKRAEQWMRDDAGRIWYSRIFHAERKVIDYQPADLALGGVTDSWERIQSIIDVGMLSGLKRESEEQFTAGRRAVVYRGTLGDVETEVWWIEELGLPAFVQKRTKHGSLTLALLDVAILAAKNDRAPVAPRLDGYETLEFSDLGDHHHDPFVESLMKYEGLWFGH